ncbi:hypothetical protein Tco_0287135 [Tanacetum coccineum]
MSSPNRSTFDIEDACSSMNILNYTSVSSDYFPASSGSSSFNSSENSKDNMIPPVFSSFYNNPCLKDVQAFYAKELPISSPDPITPPAILTPSPVLPPSLLFDPRYFFVPEELLPPKKRIHSPSSSSTTLSNSSRNKLVNLGQIEDILDELYLHHIEKIEEGRIDRMIIRRNSDELKTELKRIRTQIIKPQKKKLGQKDKIAFAHYRISNLEQIIKELSLYSYPTSNELYLHRIERMEEGRINGNELKTELNEIRTQIIKLQKKQLGQKDKIAFAHYRIYVLEQNIEKIQARHQTNQEDL